MKINGYDYRENRYYTKKHLWVQVSKNIAKIGIDAILVQRLSDIDDIELTYIDNECELNDPIGTITYDAEILELLSPLTGKITNVNDEVENDPTLLFEDPYDRGWLVEILLSPGQDLSRLMKEDDAETWFRMETEKDQL